MRVLFKLAYAFSAGACLLRIDLSWRVIMSSKQIRAGRCVNKQWHLTPSGNKRALRSWPSGQRPSGYFRRWAWWNERGNGRTGGNGSGVALLRGATFAGRAACHLAFPSLLAMHYRLRPQTFALTLDGLYATARPSPSPDRVPVCMPPATTAYWTWFYRRQSCDRLQQVTADMKTFLHSKTWALHFVLLPELAFAAFWSSGGHAAVVPASTPWAWWRLPAPLCGLPIGSSLRLALALPACALALCTYLPVPLYTRLRLYMYAPYKSLCCILYLSSYLYGSLADGHAGRGRRGRGGGAEEEDVRKKDKNLSGRKASHSACLLRSIA